MHKIHPIPIMDKLWVNKFCIRHRVRTLKMKGRGVGKLEDTEHLFKKTVSVRPVECSLHEHIAIR